MNEWMRDSRDVDAREGAKERKKARVMSTAAARALSAVVESGRDGAYRDRGWGASVEDGRWMIARMTIG